MSKLIERFPAMGDTESKLEVVNGTIEQVAREDGRINIQDLTNAVEEHVKTLDAVDDKILEEGRKAAAQQIVSAWRNARTIRIDRSRRVPVYQDRLGFASSYFKVGSELVPPAAMQAEDFQRMLDRLDERIQNAQVDKSAWEEFYNTARPGLEQGQNLVEQFEAGVLALDGTTQEIEAS